jgi:hypothetical protein
VLTQASSRAEGLTGAMKPEMAVGSDRATIERWSPKVSSDCSPIREPASAQIVVPPVWFMTLPEADVALWLAGFRGKGDLAAGDVR